MSSVSDYKFDFTCQTTLPQLTVKTRQSTVFILSLNTSTEQLGFRPKNVGATGHWVFSRIIYGVSPFNYLLSKTQMAKIIEDITNADVLDEGGYQYGGNQSFAWHMRVANGAEMVAQVLTGDEVAPGEEVTAEAAHFARDDKSFIHDVLGLLQSVPDLLVCDYKYHEECAQFLYRERFSPNDEPRPRYFGLQGRDGNDELWYTLTSPQKCLLLQRMASMRAALFKVEVPLDLAVKWLAQRLPAPQPPKINHEVTGTRNFCIELLKAMVETIIGQGGDAVGEACATSPTIGEARELILEVIGRIAPQGSEATERQLYRLVLEHGDYGIHNMDIFQEKNVALATGLHGWDKAYIVPAILADLDVQTNVKVTIDEESGMTAYTDLPEYLLPTDMVHMAPWADQYFERISQVAPEYRQQIIEDGRRLRYVWHALRDFDLKTMEKSWEKLGRWARIELEDMEENDISTEESEDDGNEPDLSEDEDMD
jgi:hypothetical protein